MTTFTFGLISGLPLTMWLSTLPMPTLEAIFGCLAGVAMALAAIYLYLLTQRDGYHIYRKPAPQRTQKRHTGRRDYSIRGVMLPGALALAQGVSV